MSFSLISCKSQEINKNSYFLNYDFGGNYTISCNGIIIAESNDSSISHSYRILNPFISEKGKQNISLKIKHPNKELKINPKEIENFFLEIYMSDNGENAPFKKIKKLTLPPIPKPVDSIFYTWEFDADVNYKLENIFDKASDLTKEKPESLLKDVLNKYEENFAIINEGNVNKYSQLIEKRLLRETTSMYYSEEEKQNYKNKVLQRVKLSKGIMQPIQDYKIVVHPNNKIVNLVNSKGEPVLYSKDENSKIKTFGLKLYRDKETGELKVY